MVCFEQEVNFVVHSVLASLLGARDHCSGLHKSLLLGKYCAEDIRRMRGEGKDRLGHRHTELWLCSNFEADCKGDKYLSPGLESPDV